MIPHLGLVSSSSDLGDWQDTTASQSHSTLSISASLSPFRSKGCGCISGIRQCFPGVRKWRFTLFCPVEKGGGGGTPAGAPTKHTCCRDDCAIERGNDLQKSAGICCRLEISQFKGLFRLPMGQLDAASAALAEESPMQTVQATQFALREARP